MKFGLLWHSMNADNLGVGALTVAHIEILRSAAAKAGVEPRFLILGWDDPNPPYFVRDDIEAAGLRLTDFAKPTGGFLDKVRSCDILFDIGAGDSFSDIYGTPRILKMIAAQNIVRAAGRPLVLSPQTIGPFSSGAISRLALSVLRSAALVSSRDDLSVACARQMGFEGDIVEASDVALRLPFDAPHPRDADVIRVGVNLSGLLMSGGYTGANMFSLKADYPALARDIIRFFRTALRVELHLVPHVISDAQEVEDDYRASIALAAEFPGVIVAPKFASPSMAKSYIAGMDYFIGARMHACIAAFSAGVPVTPLAYSRKFEGLFGAIGYTRVADCRSETGDAIVDRIKADFAQRRIIADEMHAPMQRGLARLDAYEAAAAKLIADVAAATRKTCKKTAA